MTRGPSGEGGVLLVSKPAGPTSHDVVERVRRSPLAGGAKVGHAGTLDPFATGLLLVLVGRATRVQRFLMALPKTYRAEARFGVVSDTGDPTGQLEPSGLRTSEAAVRKALPRFTGAVRQRVPLTSAVKVGGERLYRKARRGEPVETLVRAVHVGRLDLTSFDERQQVAELEIDCSSGTYVRQLIADLGELCGAWAYCRTLERLRIGPFKLAHADEEVLLPLSEALGFLPERPLNTEEARLARHGAAVEGGTGTGKTVRLTLDGQTIAIAERRDGKLQPVAVLSW
jgi:tRNA pseudouridine55 synthase